MTILDRLTTQELAKQILQNEVQDELDFIIEITLADGSAGSAFKVYKKLAPAIQQAELPSDGRKKYDDALDKIKFAALSNLGQSEASELLSTRLLHTLKDGVDVQDKVQRMFLPFLNPSDILEVDWILRSLEQNNELLINNIVLPDGKQSVGTVGNVIRLYKNSPYFKDGGSLGIANFVANDKNIKLGGDQGVDLVRKVLNIYEWVRLKSLSREELFIEEGSDSDESAPGSKVFSKPAPVAPPVAKPSLSKPVMPAVPVAPKVLTDFDKKLSQVSAIPKGASINFLKTEIQQRTMQMPKIDSPSPGLRPPSPKGGGQSGSNPLTAEEIRREVKTPELPGPVLTSSSHGLSSIADVKTTDDLKKLDLANLKQGTLAGQIQAIRAKVTTLTSANNTLPYYVVLAFEQSPLFKAYLSHGSSRVVGTAQSGELSQEEFEALADLRKDLEKL